MLRKGLIVCLMLCLFASALAEEEIPYFTDVSGELPVSEDRTTAGMVLQTYEDAETGDCAAFSVQLLESGFTLTEKALTESGAVRMTYEREDALLVTEYDQGTLRVSCPDVRRDEIALAQVGDIVPFGNYAGESISWIVLEDQGGRLLLVSQYILESMPYHDAYTDTTWKRCSLRKWLNDTFLQEAFSESERAKLLPDENRDTVTLPSAEYACAAGTAAPTAHALANGCNVWENGCGWYYLREQGYTAKSASCVRQDGKVFYEDVNCSDMGVRVAVLYGKGIKYGKFL